MTQTFIDKCSGEIKIATTSYVNGNAVVMFYNQIKTFTPSQVQTGKLQIWLQETYTAYNSMGCPTNLVVQQTVTQQVAAAATAAASQAASAAASAASSAASGAASSAASSSASSAASSTAASSTPPPSSSGSSSSNSSSSSETKSGGSTEQKSESKSESKSEEKKEESKSESKKEEKKEESKEEKKKEEKKEEKKKQQNMNPMLIASDLTTAQSPDGSYSLAMTVGLSKSSLMGDKSYSLNGMAFSTFDQFAVSSGVTVLKLTDKGQLNSINSYSFTSAYLKGTLMGLLGYTWIKPHPKYGTYGYNVGLITLLMKGDESYTTSLSTSAVIFWTKPFQYSKKLTVSPQVFTMYSPLGYNTLTGGTMVGRQVGFLVGSTFDYKLTKRFGFSFNYKLNLNTEPGSPILNNFLIGSRVML